MNFFNKQIWLFYNTWININLLKEALMFLLLLIIMKLYISAYCTYIDLWILMIPSVLQNNAKLLTVSFSHGQAIC